MTLHDPSILDHFIKVVGNMRALGIEHKAKVCLSNVYPTVEGEAGIGASLIKKTDASEGQTCMLHKWACV